MFMLIDCAANSNAAETYTAEKRKMTVFPPINGNILCRGTGRQNQLFKCKDATVGNAENRHLERKSIM
jgi:hypothetical protein